jgi:hypothetical protein
MSSQVRGACMQEERMHAWLMLDQAAIRLLQAGCRGSNLP